MTDDLISRQAAIDELMETVEDHRSDQFGGALLHWTGVKAILTGLPSAQLERKRGRWEARAVMDYDKIISQWQQERCSECGKFHTTPFVYCFNDYGFCPHCGAKMSDGIDVCPLEMAEMPEDLTFPMCDDCPDNCPLEVEHDRLLAESARWIPVKERMPEEEGGYLVTFELPSGTRYSGILYYTERLRFDDDYVVAWMPMPEPWEGNDG